MAVICDVQIDRAATVQWLHARLWERKCGARPTLWATVKRRQKLLRARRLWVRAKSPLPKNFRPQRIHVLHAGTVVPIEAHMLKEREFAPDVVAKAMQVNQNHCYSLCM